MYFTLLYFNFFKCGIEPSLMTSAGFARQRRGEESSIVYLAKDGILFPLFMTNEPGTEEAWEDDQFMGKREKIS
jgi:hypothetical protein